MKHSTLEWRILVIALLALLLLPGCGMKRKRFEHSIVPSGLPAAAPEISSRFAIPLDPERIELTREYLRIHNPDLSASLGEDNTVDSIRFEPKMIVVHFTDIPSLLETIEYFRANHIEDGRPVIRSNGLLNVGIQFVVDSTGSIYRSYPEENIISRHTIGLNHAAIGIENVGNGDLHDSSAAQPLTESQLHANLLLIRHLVSKYPSIQFLIGHSEYRDVEDPSHPAHHLFQEEFPDYRTEKVDPGPHFMRRLRDLLKAEAGH